MTNSKGNETPVVIFGKEYPSIRIAYKALKPDVSENTVRARLRYKEKYGWTDEEAFGLIKRKRRRRTVKKDKNSNDVKNNKEKKMRTTIKVKEVEYPSIKAAIDAHKATPSIVYNRVSLKTRQKEEALGRELTEEERNRIIEEAILTPKQLKTIVVDGVKYRSANDYFTQHGKVKLSTFNYRRSLGKPIKYCAGVEDEDGNPT